MSFVQTRRARIPTLALTLVLGSTLACGGRPAKPALMANLAKEDVTVAQLRAMNYEYAAHFGQLVAASVTEIIQASADPEVQDRAFRWRLWATPQARAAAFDQDPFAGMLELWVLAVQQHQYFDEGPGRADFGEQQERALETTRFLVQDVEAMAAEVMPEDRRNNLTESVRGWISRHPIEGQLYVRPTARADLAALVPEEQHGGLKAVGSIEETFRDLNDRLTILTTQLPVEARWQAEYLTQALFEQRMQEPADAVVRSMEQISGFLDEFEATLGAQTNALLDGFQRERLAVFDAVEDERQMILTAVEQERVSIMDKLDTQLAAATAELDEVGRGLIDHFFVRLIEVLAVAGLVAFLCVILVVYALRRGRPGKD